MKAEGPGASSFKPPLEKVEEVEERTDANTGLDSKSGIRCPSFYGVKSYLHNFYESGFKDPNVYEEDEYAYLLRPSKPRSKFCKPIVWKATVWIGVNFLIFGIIGIFVAYCVPKKHGYQKDGKYLVMIEEAQAFNYNLEIVKLSGMLLFCFGGAITIIGLLVPTFLGHYCDESRRDEEFKIRVGVPTASGGAARGVGDQTIHDGDGSGGEGAKVQGEGHTPLNMASPISPTTTVGNVQPERRHPESVITKQGLKEMDKS